MGSSFEDAREVPAPDLVDVDEAAAILEVTPDRVDAMMEQGLLVAAEGSDGGRSPRFRRDTVMALRELGG